jgi:hypothetical protein
VAEHQANYERITTLRAMADTLDGQIKATIQLFADTRREIQNLPWTPVDESLRSVPVNELLTFAKHVSKFTLPPSGIDRSAEAPLATAADTLETPAIGNDEGMVDAQEAQLRKDATFANSVIPEDQKLWLDEGQRRPWVPWPTEDLIRQSGLAELTRRAAEGQAIPNTLEINTKVASVSVPDEQDVPTSAQDLMSAIPRDDLPSAGVRSAKERPKKAAFHGFGLYNPEEDED